MSSRYICRCGFKTNSKVEMVNHCATEPIKSGYKDTHLWTLNKETFHPRMSNFSLLSYYKDKCMQYMGCANKEFCVCSKWSDKPKEIIFEPELYLEQDSDGMFWICCPEDRNSAFPSHISYGIHYEIREKWNLTLGKQYFFNIRQDLREVENFLKDFIDDWKGNAKDDDGKFANLKTDWRTYAKFEVVYDDPKKLADKFEIKIIEKNGKRDNTNAVDIHSLNEEVPE